MRTSVHIAGGRNPATQRRRDVVAAHSPFGQSLGLRLGSASLTSQDVMVLGWRTQVGGGGGPRARGGGAGGGARRSSSRRGGPPGPPTVRRWSSRASRGVSAPHSS